MQLFFQLHQEFVDHPQYHFVIECAEGNDGIQPIPELRAEHLLDVLHFVAQLLFVGKAHQGLLQRLLTRIGGHDDDYVAEIGLSPVVIGQSAVIHDLQQNVENVGVRLFNFVEKEYRVGLFGDRFGQQAALLKSHITRRRTNQAGNGVPFHVFGHVEADQFNAQKISQLFGNFGFSDPGRAGEQEGTGWLSRIAQPRSCHLDGLGKRFNSGVLAKYRGLEIALDVFELRAIVSRYMLRRNTRNFGDDFFDLCFANGLLLLRFGQNTLRCAGFVNDVNRLIRQVTISNVSGGQFNRRSQGGRGILDSMVRLKA